MRHSHRTGRSDWRDTRFRTRRHSNGRRRIPSQSTGSPALRAQGIHPGIRRHRGCRRKHYRRGVSQHLPCAAFIHRRRFGGDFMPRFALHTPADHATPHSRRMPHSRTGGIHAKGIPQRQNGPVAGRGGGRSHSIDIGSIPQNGDEPDARFVQQRAVGTARPSASPHIANGTRTRLLRPRRA